MYLKKQKLHFLHNYTQCQRTSKYKTIDKCISVRIFQFVFGEFDSKIHEMFERPWGLPTKRSVFCLSWPSPWIFYPAIYFSLYLWSSKAANINQWTGGLGLVPFTSGAPPFVLHETDRKEVRIQKIQSLEGSDSREMLSFTL